MGDSIRPVIYVLCGLVFVLLAARPVRAQPQSFFVDSDSSEFTFAVEHLGMFTVNGSFQLSSGTVDVDWSSRVPTRAIIELNTESIKTDNESRDEDLRSEDFLDALRYPTIRFEGHTIKHGETTSITGRLTISGNTEEIQVPFKFEIRDDIIPATIIVRSHFKLSRETFDLSFGRFMDAMVGDEISVRIRIVARSEA